MNDFQTQVQILEQDIGSIGEKLGEMEERFAGEKQNNLDDFLAAINKFVTAYSHIRTDSELKRIQEEKQRQKKEQVQTALLTEIHKGVKLKPKIKESENNGKKKKWSEAPTGSYENLQSELAQIGMFANQLQRQREEQEKREKKKPNIRKGPTNLDKLLRSFNATQQDNNNSWKK